MPPKRRANHMSSIDKLPPEIREEIGRQRQAGRTIDEILDKLRELDVDVSRSALGRHVRGLAQIGADMRRSREMATALVARFGEEPDDKLARLNLELMHGAVFHILTAMEEGEDGEPAPVSFSPGEAKAMAQAMQALVGAQKSDAERTLKLQAEFAKAAVAKLDQAASRGEIDAVAMARAKRILGFE